MSSMLTRDCWSVETKTICWIYSSSSKLFLLEVHERSSLAGPVRVILQEETGVHEENLWCLVESNWKHSSHM